MTGPIPPGGERRLFVLVMAVAAILRLPAVGKPLYIDEIVTITVARQPLSQMDDVMRQIDASPALYPLLLHAWLFVAQTDIWVRLLSVVFGIAAVGVVYFLARRLFGPSTAVASALVIAVAPAHVHYAQYVRSYSLFTLLAAAHLWLFAAWFRTPGGPSRRLGLAYVGVTTAFLYTHYLSLLLFPAEGLYALWTSGLRARFWQWIAATAVAGALFLPGLPLLLHNMAFDRIRNDDRPEPPPLVRLVPDLAGEMTLGQRSLGFSDPTVRRATLAAAAIVFPALALVGVRHGLRTHRDATVFLLLVAVVPTAIYVLSGRRLVAVRFFLPFMIGYAVLLGHGLAVLGRRARLFAVLAVVTLCAIPLTHFYTRFSWSYDHEAVASTIRQQSRAGDVLLFVHPYEAFYYEWYLGSALPMEGLVFTALEDQGTYVIKPPALDLEVARRRVDEAAEDYRRIWVIGGSRRSFASDPSRERALFAWLDTRFHDPVLELPRADADDPIIRLYETGVEKAS